MKYTKIPADTFKNIQLNAGILASEFDPEEQEYNGILGATSGGVNFTATPTYEDFGADIDNCPTNTKELKKLTEWAVSMAGTFVSVTPELAKKLVAAGDIDAQNATHIIPRNDIYESDFEDLWFIGDYSNVNEDSADGNAGFIAIHVMNALSTGGFQIQSSNKAKGTFSFTFTGHYSMADQDTVPFEIYIVEGNTDVLPSILLNVHTLKLSVGDTYQLTASTNPSGQTISWDTVSGDDDYITVSNSGLVTAVAEGNDVINAIMTIDSVDYVDTCTVIVEGD